MSRRDCSCKRAQRATRTRPRGAQRHAPTGRCAACQSRHCPPLRVRPVKPTPTLQPHHIVRHRRVLEDGFPHTAQSPQRARLNQTMATGNACGSAHGQQVLAHVRAALRFTANVVKTFGAASSAHPAPRRQQVGANALPLLAGSPVRLRGLRVRLLHAQPFAPQSTPGTSPHRRCGLAGSGTPHTPQTNPKTVPACPGAPAPRVRGVQATRRV